MFHARSNDNKQAIDDTSVRHQESLN